MPYTSQGWASHGDIQEIRKDMDMGSTDIQPDDPPEWFDTAQTCPVCGSGMDDHEAGRVADASGEIYACLPLDAAGWLELPDEGGYW